VKKKSGKKLSGPKAYLAKVKDEEGNEIYVAAVRKKVKQIPKSQTENVKKHLEERQKAAEELGKIIDNTGICTASIHRVTVVGEEDGETD